MQLELLRGAQSPIAFRENVKNLELVSALYSESK